MKKIALCSLLVGLCSISAVPVFAGTCDIRSLTWNEDEEGDEYLYLSQSHRQNQRAFACETGGDNSNCSNGAKVVISGEGQHIGDVFTTNGTEVYQCRTTGWASPADDKWTQEGTSSLPHCKEIKGYEKFSEMDAYNVIYCKKIEMSGNRKYCVAREEGDVCIGRADCKDCEKTVENQCTFSDGSKHNLGESVEYDCSQAPNTPEFQQNARTGVKCYQSCLRRLSDNALTNYWSVKTCPKGKGYVAFDSSDYQKYTPDIPGYKRCDNANVLPEIVVTPEIKSCKDSRSTVNGKACCDIPSNEAKYDAKTDKCNCLNDKVFEIDASGRGKCVAKEQNEEPCYYNYTGYIRCPNGNFSLTMKQYKLEKSDLEGKSCDEFKRLYENDVNASETLRAKICAEKQSAIVVTVPVGPSETQIKDARDTLKTFAANAEAGKSGWKTAEGKFNTTRLASDLTAGVVLGTVGGVVSGVVIKKKQVEKGFDALHCTVGGQKIADWGDTFTVGLQR